MYLSLARVLPDLLLQPGVPGMELMYYLSMRRLFHVIKLVVMV
jgi:hypothetical protein